MELVGRHALQVITETQLPGLAISVQQAAKFVTLAFTADSA
jgi:hypothetical protein